MKFSFFVVFTFVCSTLFGQKLSFNQVRDSINTIMQEEDIPGISLAVINKKDSLYWAGGLGFSDIENSTPLTKNSIMFIASTSKNFIALGILKLVEDNKIRLTTPIKEVIPEIKFKNEWSDESPITLEMVLEHTTGFDETRYNNFIGDENDHYTLKELLNKYPNALQSRWRPGTMFSYSNINYTVAGYIIEKITGMPFEDYIKQSILDPMEMTQTKLRGFTTKYPNITVPYTYDFEKQKSIPLFPNGGIGKNFLQRPASFVITSSNDMLKYLDFYLSVNKKEYPIVKKESIDRMENGVTSYESQLQLEGRYGLGNKPGLREVRLFGHNGIAWNSSFFMYNRDEGIGYYVATNCSYAIPRIRKLLNAFLLQDYSVKEVRKCTEAKIAKPFEGFYVAQNSRNGLLLFFDKIRFAGSLKIDNDTVFFDGGLKMRKYKAFKKIKEHVIPLKRVDKEFERQMNFASAGLMYDVDNEPMVVWDSGTSMVYFKKTSKFLYYFKKVSFFASFFVLVIGLLIIVINAIIKLFRRKLKVSIPNVFILIASIGVMVMLWTGISLNPIDQIAMGDKNLRTISFYLASLTFPLATAFFLFFGMKRVLRTRSIVSKSFYFITAYAMVYLSVFMIQNGFVGLQFWNY
ncbi:serine hydrolase domain-containing protein [Aestuariivivens insulae]|uniref:serine hydrolase domain-containing protein n=1 Tax=Aestuariivivens insulae TaxID=1621988 RepID=UPI0021D3F92B|nr:serine hydrolase domain-containing protein [Aestuariivivens insulae]